MESNTTEKDISNPQVLMRNKNRPFQCNMCKWSFKQKAHLQRHKLSNHTDRQSEVHTCSLCGKCYTTINKLISHELEVHQQLLHTECLLCKKTFDTACAVASHYKDCHSKDIKAHFKQKEFFCQIGSCDERYTSDFALRKHYFSKHSNLQFHCTVCSKHFITRSNLFKHMRSIHNAPSGSQLTCEHCEDMFVCERSKYMHVKKHDNQTDILCKDCPLRFFTVSKLSAHIVKAHWNTGCKCYKCHKVFTKDCTAKDHLRGLNCPAFRAELHTANLLSAASNTCVVCAKMFSSASKLTHHQKIHSSEKTFSCTQCNKSFSMKGNLDQHIKAVHSGIKRKQSTSSDVYSCTQCHLRLSSAYDLKIHTRSHTGEKPFLCSLCERSFSQKGNMNIHIKRWHTGPQKGKSPIFKKSNNINDQVVKFTLSGIKGAKPANYPPAMSYIYSLFKKRSMSLSNDYVQDKRVVIYPPVMQSNLELLAKTITEDFQDQSPNLLTMNKVNSLINSLVGDSKTQNGVRLGDDITKPPTKQLTRFVKDSVTESSFDMIANNFAASEANSKKIFLATPHIFENNILSYDDVFHDNTKHECSTTDLSLAADAIKSDDVDFEVIKTKNRSTDDVDDFPNMPMNFTDGPSSYMNFLTEPLSYSNYCQMVTNKCVGSSSVIKNIFDGEIQDINVSFMQEESTEHLFDYN